VEVKRGLRPPASYTAVDEMAGDSGEILYCIFLARTRRFSHQVFEEFGTFASLIQVKENATNEEKNDQ